jgi:hypothetical protein
MTEQERTSLLQVFYVVNRPIYANKRKRDIVMNLKRLFSILSLGAVALGSTAALAADSASAITVSDIRFNNDGQLFLNTSDGFFWATNAADGTACPLRSLDVRKSWLSMAQSAFLSGKKLHVVYNACSSGRKGIAELWLVN